MSSSLDCFNAVVSSIGGFPTLCLSRYMSNVYPANLPVSCPGRSRVPNVCCQRRDVEVFFGSLRFKYVRGPR